MPREANFAYQLMMTSAKELLLKKRAITIPELEDHLYAGFHKEWEDGAYDSLEGKRRLRWDNFTDHVKANLTKQEFTERVEVLGIPYLCHTPERGDLNREGAFVLCSEHWKTLAKLAQRISQEYEAA